MRESPKTIRPATTIKPTRSESRSRVRRNPKTIDTRPAKTRPPMKGMMGRVEPQRPTGETSELYGYKGSIAATPAVNNPKLRNFQPTILVLGVESTLENMHQRKTQSLQQ